MDRQDHRRGSGLSRAGTVGGAARRRSSATSSIAAQARRRGCSAQAPIRVLVNALFFPTTFRVMGHIAKADGRVSEQEIASARAVMHALRLHPGSRFAAIGYFDRGQAAGLRRSTAALQRLRACDRARILSWRFLRRDPAAGGARRQRPVGTAARATAARRRDCWAAPARVRAPREHPALAAERTGAGAGGGRCQARAATAMRPASAERLAQAYSLLEAGPRCRTRRS